MERIKTILSFMEDRGEEPFLLFALANEYIKLGEMQKANEAFESLWDEHQSYTGFYYHYVLFLMKENRIKKAKMVFDQGIKMCRSENQLHDLRELQALGMELDDNLG